jgi:hypothetical protein
LDCFYQLGKAFRYSFAVNLNLKLAEETNENNFKINTIYFRLHICLLK